MCPLTMMLLSVVPLARPYKIVIFLFVFGIVLILGKAWDDRKSRNRKIASSDKKFPHACPSCGSVDTILIRQTNGTLRDMSFYVCQACRKRSGEGIWSDPPEPADLRGEGSGTLGRLLEVKERVSGPRPDVATDWFDELLRDWPVPPPVTRPREDVAGLIDAIRRDDRRPRRINLPIRDRPPLWDDWLDGGP